MSGINFDPFKFRGTQQQPGDGVGGGGLRPAQANPWTNMSANSGNSGVDTPEFSGTLPTGGGQAAQGSNDPTLNRMNRYMADLAQLQGDMKVLKAMGYNV